MKTALKCLLMAYLVHSAVALAQEKDPWIGRRVLTHDFAVPVENRDRIAFPEPLNKPWRDFRIYRVTRTNREWLWLEEENGKIRGWMKADKVIPYDQSIAYFTALIRRDPTAVRYQTRGGIWQSMGQDEKAFADYGEAIRLNPDLVPTYMDRGNLYRQREEYGKAIADYGRAIRLDPTHSWAYNFRGACWYFKKRYKNANADFNKAIRLNPSEASSYVNRGNVRREWKQYDKAIADYTLAIRLDSKDEAAYNNRGVVWRAVHQYDKALADLNEAIRLDPKYAVAYSNRGLVRRSRGEYDKALADFDEAIRLDPKLADSHLGRGGVWMEKKEYDHALDDLNEAIRLDPENAIAFNGRGWVMATCPVASLRDGKRAVESATRACELSEWKNAILLDTLAAAYAEAGEFDKAVEWEGKSRKLSTDAVAIKKCDQRLALYKDKKPYREEPGK